MLQVCKEHFLEKRSCEKNNEAGRGPRKRSCEKNNGGGGGGTAMESLERPCHLPLLFACKTCPALGKKCAVDNLYGMCRTVGL